jgi:aminoglycoside phosphotransferase (APT) family kinase protein
VSDIEIDTVLVTRLIAEQFPLWAHLPVMPVVTSGWDNRTFHLGDAYSVRLPSAATYADAVLKEHTWLPWLAPQLPLPIPQPVALGLPSSEFPWHWSVYKWLPGDSADQAEVSELTTLARDLAEFLCVLQSIDTSQAPPMTKPQMRGGSLLIWDQQFRAGISRLQGNIDTAVAQQIWDAALAAPFEAQPVWFHGDVAVGNLLIEAGRLSAVIDFGGLGVGDPACDMAIAWTYFDPSSRAVFRESLAVSDAVWSRGKGWALWKGVIILAGLIESNAVETQAAPRAVQHLLEEV